MNNQFVLPIHCKSCGRLFDLWYELLESEEKIENEEIQEKLGQKLAESICWDCKKYILQKINTPNPYIEDKKGDDELDELFLELGYG